MPKRKLPEALRANAEKLKRGEPLNGGSKKNKVSTKKSTSKKK